MTPSSLKVAALVPKTGMSCGCLPNAPRLRTSWRPTSRSASLAPRRSNLLIATVSAKSSMSIFSSCEAAPNSGVITYSEWSTNGTIAASPWPMPGVSTITRSKPAALTRVDHVGEVLGHLVRAAGGQGAEEDPVAVEGVRADPVAEQRAAALAAGRVDRDDGDPQLVLLVDAEAADQLVGEAGLARAAGAGDAEHRRRCARPRPRGCGSSIVLGQPPGLGAGDRPGHREPVAGQHRLDVGLALLPGVEVAVGDHGVDHADQAHPLAVLGGEDRHPGLAQPRDLRGHDHAAAAADDPDVVGAGLAQRLHEVLEVLHVAALVRRDRDALDVLLERRVDDLLHRAVVPEVDDLAALALEDPPHDVDRRVVAVEQARGGDEADGVLGRWSSGMKVPRREDSWTS